MRFAFLCRDKPEPSNRKIAIIGAGPAGLSATGYLVCHGHEVHIFDKLPEPGGLMLFGIPEFRIPISRVREGFAELRDIFGVKFHGRTKIVFGNKPDEGDSFVDEFIEFDKLIKDFDAVLIATGTWKSIMPKIEGGDLKGVLPALSLLFKIKCARLGYISWDNITPLKEKTVVIIGAGHTAVDAAIECMSLGASKIYMCYRRTILEAPAGYHEINFLKNRGVIWYELSMPTRIIGENGNVKAIELQQCKLSKPDKNGRRYPIPIENQFVTIDTNYIIYAIGQKLTPPFQQDIDVKLDDWGRIIVDDLHMTSREGIFAAGDIVIGPSKVGRAIQDGLYAAEGINYWLMGEQS